ncbi:MAG: sulfatase [Planctomycetaceae bacterium]|nr:sulfatase [Planctomycetaceae bacterium]
MACGMASADTRPNILWIIVDDMSPNFGCYGEQTIATPRVDALAAAGTRFSRAFVTAPVCSACRSALITGMYQTSIGAHHHRSGRGVEKITLPTGVVPIPELFRAAGYFTCITSWPRGKGLGKTDYNFTWDPAMYDGPDWSARRPGQPFFAQVQLHGGKHRDGGGLKPPVQRALGTLTDPARVKLPPYYPEDDVLRRDWAAYLDAVRYTDLQVGEVLDRLEREKLADSTVVFFMTDHGISHARGKQFLYDEGIHVPLVVRGPGWAAQAVRDDLVEHIDLAATSLALAGIARPTSMQGRDLSARDLPAREAVFAARDRCDETVDQIRSVRTAQFKYIRNYLPSRPHLQPNRYKDGKPTVRRLRELHDSGQLSGLPEQLLFAEHRPTEELYDLTRDPFETRNLAADPAQAETLRAMRQRLEQWLVATGDRGQQPEPAAMYESDMAEYLGSQKRDLDSLRKNIELMKRWAAEGR